MTTEPVGLQQRDHLVVKVVRLDGGKPQPRYRSLGEDPFDKPGHARTVGAGVRLTAVRAQIDAGENDLLPSLSRQLGDASDDLLGGHAARPPPRGWDDTVGTEVRAALLGVDEGACSAVQALCARRGFRRQGLHHVHIVHGIRATVLRALPAQFIGQPRDLTSVSGIDDQIDALQLTERFTGSFHETAGDSHDRLRPTTAHLPDKVTRLAVRHVRDRAGIHYVDISRLRGRDDLIVKVDELPEHSLRIRLIHFAAQRLDGYSGFGHSYTSLQYGHAEV